MFDIILCISVVKLRNMVKILQMVFIYKLIFYLLFTSLGTIAYMSLDVAAQSRLEERLPESSLFHSRLKLQLESDKNIKEIM